MTLLVVDGRRIGAVGSRTLEAAAAHNRAAKLAQKLDHGRGMVMLLLRRRQQLLSLLLSLGR